MRRNRSRFSLPTKKKCLAAQRGSTALDAAGTIHSDLARGFIRAEIMAVDDLLRLGSEREVKAANLYHTVGKDHVMRDGDEIVVRFNV